MKRVTGEYVQFGCGYSVGPGWLNFDASPTLRIERLPIVGPVLSRLSGNVARFPSQVLYGNIVKGLPLPSQSVRGLYGSHVLEHLSLNDARSALAECHRLLSPDGLFRLIVPDLRGRAEAYLKDSSPDSAHRFMRGSYLGLATRQRGLLRQLKAALGNSAHLWMWDEASMTEELKQAGFSDIRRAMFGDSSDPMFNMVEDETRFIDGPFVEVALECRRRNGSPS